MFATLRTLADDLRSLVAALDPSRMEGEDAALLLLAFAELERLAVAGRMRLTPRVEAARAVWQRDGHRTFASWLASETGQPLGTAIATADAAKRLDELPATSQAVAAGQLSEPQLREVVSGATADPSSEDRLLACARDGSLRGLREAVRRTRAAAAPDEDARYRAIHDSRYARWWSESDGAVRLSARFAPDAGAEVIAGIEARQDRLFQQARKQDRRESSEALAADALVAMARDAETGGNASSKPRAMVHVRVDHAALVRGRAEPGEVCEIPGVGEIPVASARALLGDAILKVLVVDGVDVRTVAHAGRTVPASLRTALEERDPVCVVPACVERKNLQIDHYGRRYVTGGLLSLDNACRICDWHHYLKTHCGFLLEGPPDDWRWFTPDEQEGITEASARPPPAA